VYEIQGKNCLREVVKVRGYRKGEGSIRVVYIALELPVWIFQAETKFGNLVLLHFELDRGANFQCHVVPCLGRSLHVNLPHLVDLVCFSVYGCQESVFGALCRVCDACQSDVFRGSKVLPYAVWYLAVGTPWV
jgi:hypothetical protein